MTYRSINILDAIEQIGESATQELISDFSCSKNQDIQHFLQHNAIDFAKRKISITHLVFDEEKRIVGYYTLAHKPLLISEKDRASLSKSDEKKIARYCKLDEDSGAYTVSAFLIAQFGKSDRSSIGGNELMQAAVATLTMVQRQVGGGIIFLECEDHEKLLAFYQNEQNCYKRYGFRKSDKDAKTYVRLLRFF